MDQQHFTEDITDGDNDPGGLSDADDVAIEAPAQGATYAEDITDGDNNTGLSDADEVAIEALAHGATYADAGKAAGYSARTVSRRLEDELFSTRLEERKREVREEHVRDVRRLGRVRISAAVRAQQVLLELLEDENPKVRLNAAKELSSGAAARNLDHEERLLRLEGRLENPGEVQPPSGWSL